MRAAAVVVLLLLAVVISVAVADAADVAVGDWVELGATGPQGVPLHRQPSPGLAGQAPDGSRGQVTHVADGGQWLRLRLEDGRTGWIMERHVERVIAAPGFSGPDPADERTVWESEAGCRQVIATGRRAAATRADVLRIATWNLRWFPDETNVEWLACVVAWLNLDLLAVTEVRRTDPARVAMSQLLLTLVVHTRTGWAVDFQECGPAGSPHVGFLWNTARVALADQKDLWQLNARARLAGSPCATSLRPGRYAYVRTVGPGVDFHVIAVHARSGATAAARADRLTVLRRLDDAVAPLRRADEDMVILGNFNTMGDMTPGSAEAELQTLFTTAATGEPGFVRLTVTPACTGYHQGRPSWRDHVLVSRSMTEVPPSAVGRPTSYCALRACEPMGRQRPAAYQELSSHCPVVVELVNRDED